MLTYRVVDSITGKDITDQYCWVIRPDGRLCYNYYGDLIGYSTAKLEIVSLPQDSSLRHKNTSRLDRIINLFEGYENLIELAIEADIYNKETLVQINVLADKRKQLTEELEAHGCRRRN